MRLSIKFTWAEIIYKILNNYQSLFGLEKSFFWVSKCLSNLIDKFLFVVLTLKDIPLKLSIFCCFFDFPLNKL